MMAMASNPTGTNLTYIIKKCDDANCFVGQCVEIPSIIAQGETKENLDAMLDTMAKGYYEVLASKAQKPQDDMSITVEKRPIPN